MHNIDADEITQYELDTWGRCANTYIDTFVSLTSQAIPYLLDAMGNCQGKQVLDLGSGPGNVAQLFADSGAEVTGVDFSPLMVKVAESRYPNITFLEANGERLPFDDETFDTVACNYVVHHFARPEVVFSEINRVLKPNGRLVFSVWGEPEKQSSVGAFFAAVMMHHDLAELPHGPLFGVTEKSVYEPLLTKAGLIKCQLTMHDVVWEMDSLEPLLNGFWDWGNMSALPMKTQAKIKNTTQVNAQAFYKNNRFSFPHTVLLGVAIKK
ncbi:MAG: class I SAM-dependent methyltransferase [Cognaticolwellia sp.]